MVRVNDWLSGDRVEIDLGRSSIDLELVPCSRGPELISCRTDPAALPASIYLVT